jgi:hypothetical protein
MNARIWALVIGHWSSVKRLSKEVEVEKSHWSLVIGHWSLVIGH